MDKLSAPVLLSKDYAPTTLSFEEYALKLTGITDLLDARVLAVDTVSCAESPLNDVKLMSVYCDAGSELRATTFQNSNMKHANTTKLGNLSSLSGYVSCKVVAGPLLVVQYTDKICIHDISSAELFSRPIVLSYTQNATDMQCDVFTKSCSSGNKLNTLALRFTQSGGTDHTASTSSTPTVSTVEWLLLDTTQLHHLLHNTTDTSDMPSGIGALSSLFAFNAHSTISSIDSAIVTTNSVDYNQYYDFVQASVYYIDNVVGTSSTDITPTKRSLFVGIDKSYQLQCYLDSVLLYTNALPFLYTTHATNATHMSLTNTTQPLLLLSHHTTLLLIDVLHNGTLMKEFSNVGAYMCAPLYHPLSQELFIIPYKACNRLNMWGITGGYCCTPATTTTTTTDCSTGASNSTLPLSDWFVYELPLAHTAINTGNNSTNTTRYTCRSLDCTGRGRKDSLLTIDASAYNALRWPHEVPQVPSTTNSGCSGTKRGIVDVIDTAGGATITASKTAKHDHDETTTVVAASTNSTATTTNPSSSSITNTAGTTTDSTHTDTKNALLHTLTTQLHKREQDLRDNTAAMVYKEACVDYLRSLLVRRASCASSSSSITSGSSTGACGSGGTAGTTANTDTNTNTNTYTNSNTHTIGSCTVSKAGFEEEEDEGPCTNPYLRRLECIERKYLVPVFGEKVCKSGNSGGGSTGSTSSGSSEVGDVLGDTCPLRVDSIHYTLLSNKHTVQIHSTLTNTSPTTLYNLGLSTHTDRTTLTTSSGTADYILPQTTITIVALCTLPHYLFTYSGAVETTVKIAINWRQCSVDSHTSANSDEETAYNMYSQIMSGSADSVCMGRAVGVVYVHMHDLYPAHYNTTLTNTCNDAYNTTASTNCNNVFDATYQRYLSHKRQAEVLQKNLKVAEPVLLGTRTNSSKLTITDTNTVTPDTTGITAAVTSCKIYTYVPSVQVTLSNHLHTSLTTTPRTAQDLHSALSTATSSVYSMDHVLQQLSHLSVSSNNCPVAVTVEGTGMSSGVYNKCELHFDSTTSTDTNTPAKLQHATQRTGTLHAPPVCTNRDVMLCNAVLQLRQLLPQQIDIRVHAPLDEVRNAVRRAAMCLFKECKLRAVYKRMQCQVTQSKAKNRDTTDNTVVIKQAEQRDVLLIKSILQAKVDSDRAMAHLFSIVGL